MNVLKIKPPTLVGRGNMPNLLEKTRKTEMNIIPETANNAISEDRIFSRRKRDGESFVYFVTNRTDLDEKRSEFAIVIQAPERDNISRFP